MEGPRDEDELEGEELEAEILQTDHAFGAESFGTTAEEQLEGESLDAALAAERPEPPTVDEVVSVVDEGLVDDEDELVGEAVVDRDAFVSPEDAALSVRDIAPGATDHPDPHDETDDED
jgi:hypothetical protein